MNHWKNYFVCLLTLVLSIPLCAQEDKGTEYMEKARLLLVSEDEDDREMATYYLVLAADNGNTDALSLIGGILLASHNEENYPQAVEYLQKAAAKNDGYAMRWLADCYENGYGVDVDLEMAKFWKEKAALYIDDEEDETETVMNEPDPVKGKEYYEKAKELMASGKEEDLSSAFEFLIKAAEEENTEAQTIAGYIIITNEYDEFYDVAVDYLQKAAGKGNVDAMSLLAECYEQGKGVEKDADTAKFWKDKAKALLPPVEYSYYTAQTTYDVNFREGPSTANKIIRKLPKGTYIFVDKSDYANGYYKVVTVEDDEYGYVHQKYVKFLEKVKVDEDGGMKVVQTIDSPYAEIKIENDTNVKVTMKIGKQVYVFMPHQTRTIQIDAGTYNTVLSSPGLKPGVYKDVIKGGMGYEWTIYIVSH